ncbi:MULTISPECIES: hypothetical protein [unclassified Crossiella]|uniref:hypothetical protein n=1 Tax=unclassified Crossiella TaxID=2620835 RepID=UPI001FFE848E|nr:MULTISPECIES: hypothetical protein [unclassified Crossiella]MCK2240071.1 hypothetical protein [Crossiella sp. S99.2]MCK2252779.1 hypothetical protein [Crossiella sp. S99.1]
MTDHALHRTENSSRPCPALPAPTGHQVLVTDALVITADLLLELGHASDVLTRSVIREAWIRDFPEDRQPRLVGPGEIARRRAHGERLNPHRRVTHGTRAATTLKNTLRDLEYLGALTRHGEEIHLRDRAVLARLKQM